MHFVACHVWQKEYEFANIVKKNIFSQKNARICPYLDTQTLNKVISIQNNVSKTTLQAL